MAGVEGRSLVEGPPGPEHDGQAEHQRSPPPPVELRGWNHGPEDHRKAKPRGDDQSEAQSAQFAVAALFSLILLGGDFGGVSGVPHGADQLGDELRTVGDVFTGDPRLLGRIVDGGGDAVETVESLLHAVGA